MAMPKLSIIVCANNEEKSIGILWKKLAGLLKNDFELIFINDGSTDNTLGEMQKITDKRVTVINILQNIGKNRLLPCLAFRALNEIVVTIDADLEDDLETLPAMIEFLWSNADLAIGERQRRKSDSFKLFCSKIFNSLQYRMFGLKMKDTNCGLKVFRRVAFENCCRLLKRKTQYRYIALVCFLNGYRVKPFPIQHHTRKFGKSHYGFKRIFNGIFDILSIWLFRGSFMFKRQKRVAKRK